MCFLLVFSILLINNVQADLFAPAASSANTCSVHGDVKLDLKTINALALKEITVKAKHSSEPSYYKIEGAWKDKNDYAVSSLYSNMDVKFRSSDSYFKKEGEYSIRIEYKDEYEEINIECPKFTFSCNDIDIKINECYSEGNNFVINFLGRGLETQKIVLDLEKDLEYSIKSKRQIWGFGSLPKNVSFEKLENENYKIIFPRNKDYYPADTNLLENVEIRLKEDLGTGAGSGCSREHDYRIYPNIRDMEIKCPIVLKTPPESTGNDVTIDNSENIENEAVKQEENNADITGKAISEKVKLDSSSLIIIPSVGIGLVIGILMAFLLMKKKR